MNTERYARYAVNILFVLALLCALAWCINYMVNA